MSQRESFSEELLFHTKLSAAYKGLFYVHFTRNKFGSIQYPVIRFTSREDLGAFAEPEILIAQIGLALKLEHGKCRAQHGRIMIDLHSNPVHYLGGAVLNSDYRAGSSSRLTVFERALSQQQKIRSFMTDAQREEKKYWLERILFQQTALQQQNQVETGGEPMHPALAREFRADTGFGAIR